MIYIISNKDNKHLINFNNERNKTINMKNIKERNIKIKIKKVEEKMFELRILDKTKKIIKLYNYFSNFVKLYKYFPIIKESETNYSLYSNDNPEKSLSVGFKDEKTALETIKKIKNKSKVYQKQVITTMYNRAKFHPYITTDMKKAMKIFKKWLDNN
jgi:hypothetical protein